MGSTAKKIARRKDIKKRQNIWRHNMPRGINYKRAIPPEFISFYNKRRDVIGHTLVKEKQPINNPRVIPGRIARAQAARGAKRNLRQKV